MTSAFQVRTFAVTLTAFVFKQSFFYRLGLSGWRSGLNHQRSTVGRGPGLANHTAAYIGSHLLVAFARARVPRAIRGQTRLEPSTAGDLLQLQGRE